MIAASREKEWADRARRYVKAELKRAEVSYAELARRLRDHGLEESEASITAKLNRGTFAATFFLATMLAIGVEHVRLEDL
jgi:3-mercaptopyruvate sulfurtransferase SseA